MAHHSSDLAIRQGTTSSTFGDEAVPDTDPTSAAGLLGQRLNAWKHAVTYLEEYIESVEKIHKAQAKEYEKALKTISKPLKEGQHFDQTLGGVAGFFENMRANTQALVNTNLETEKHIKGSVLPIIERLHKEIKHKTKELTHGAQKGAKEVEKARNTTQKHIELLGQQAASFDSTGGKMTGTEDPYVIKRGVMHRLSKQVLEENSHRNDLLAVQTNFQTFEAHVIHAIQEAFGAFNTLAGGQAEKTRALYSDVLGAAQRIPTDFEWKAFVARSSDVLINPSDEPRNIDSVAFPNMDHPSTTALIEGSLERKSRNKLSFGYQAGYYVVTPAKYLHEFKDSDYLRNDPQPELSIFLPDAIIGAPTGDRFHVKGKDRAKGLGSMLAGSSELAFKAHSPADAERWFDVIRGVCGATGPAEPMSPMFSGSETVSPTITAATTPTVASPTTATMNHKAQEAGVTGPEIVTSSTTALSPASITTTDAKVAQPHHTHGTIDTTMASQTAPASTAAIDEKPAVHVP